MPHFLVYLYLSEIAAVALFHGLTLIAAIAVASTATGRWLVGGTAAAVQMTNVLRYMTFLRPVDTCCPEAPAAAPSTLALMNMESPV